MRTRVYGIKPPDETWRRMKAAYDACRDAGIGIPSALDDYFNNEEPDEAGVAVELKPHKTTPDGKDCFEVDITNLPTGVKIIRFVNAY